MIDAIPHDPPLTEVEHKIIVGEFIGRGDTVAFHPRTGELVRAGWTGAIVVGNAYDDLFPGQIAEFNPAVGLFRPSPSFITTPKPTYKCEVCEDGNKPPEGPSWVCPVCGNDCIPF